MVEITAAMVRALRDRTDAPMMECKKALSEANADMDKAEELLRIKLGSKATKAASRIAAEGVVGTWQAADAKLGVMVELNCETDFVAKNEDFLRFAATLAERVAKDNPADVAALMGCAAEGATMEQMRQSLVGKIGENISVRRFVRIEAAGRLTKYVHGGARIGAMIDLVGGDDSLARDLAMHIAASKPVALSRDQVPEELIRKERDIAKAKAAESGKPANIVEKMVDGSVQKFLKEVTLLGQAFVKDDKQTVEALLRGRGATVARFALFVVGEGMEKRSGDFAAEVRAQAGLGR